MKNFYLLLLCLITSIGYTQEPQVSTILNAPSADVDDALVLDSKGNLYGSNFAGSTVYKITKSGEVSEFVTGLANPNGLAFDSQDNLFVAEYSNATIHKYDKNGNLLNSYPIPSGFPSGLIKKFNSDNIIFTNADFSDPQNNSINELLPDGTIRVLYEGAPLNIPVGLTYDWLGRLYIGNYLDRVIHRMRFDHQGNVVGNLKYIATVPAPSNQVPFLAFIAYSRGSIFGTVYGENKIYRVNPRRIDDVEIYAGSTFGDMDGNLSEATFAFPAGIVASRFGKNLYISEFSGIGNIRKITRRWWQRGPESSMKAEIKVFPNPASNFLNISIQSVDSMVSSVHDGTMSIEIFDIRAHKIYENHNLQNDKNIRLSIPVTDWNTGIYEVIISKGPLRIIKQIVKE